MILVTGGGGFVGQAVVCELIQQGHRVRVVSRHAKQLRKLPSFQSVEVVEADITEPGSLDKAMNGIQAVLHLVGIIVPVGKNRFETAHVKGTQEVIQAMKRNGVKRLVHMSALGTRSHAASRYHQTKWEAENLVRESGLDWTIFRPSLIYGSGNKMIEQLAAMMRFPLNVLQLGCVPCFGGGRTLFQPIAVEEVAYCFVRALTREISLGEIYILSGQETISFRDMLKKIAQAQGYQPTWLEAFPALYLFLIPWYVLTKSKPILVSLPFEMAYFFAAVAEKIAPRLALTRDTIKMLEEDNIGNGEKAWQDFRFTPESFSLRIQEIFKKE